MNQLISTLVQGQNINPCTLDKTLCPGYIIAVKLAGDEERLLQHLLNCGLGFPTTYSEGIAVGLAARRGECTASRPTIEDKQVTWWAERYQLLDVRDEPDVRHYVFSAGCGVFTVSCIKGRGECSVAAQSGSVEVVDGRVVCTGVPRYLQDVL